ncbi:zinc finger protein 629 [Caerostris extrusa]|uniref:Zinc finger protein 629 n=1 Tax=Caerostris extrusa TaxID=172846 RepID=A0AAV4UQ26_CAEEX|nr:zinc finger protein 629 [Caerostris extrusa]
MKQKLTSDSLPKSYQPLQLLSEVYSTKSANYVKELLKVYYLFLLKSNSAYRQYAKLNTKYSVPENRIMSPRKKNLFLPFTSLIRDGPVKKEAVLGSNNSKSTANTLHKGEVMGDCILESERLAEKILREFRLKEAQAKMPTPMVKEKDKPKINVKLKETKELESKKIPQKLTNSQSKTISLKKNIEILIKKSQYESVERKLNNNSLTKSFLQLKYKLNFPIGNKSLQSNIMISDSSILDYLVSCRFCKQSFKTLKDCDNHSCENSKLLCNQLMYKCELCPLVFKYKNYLDRHMKGHNRNNCKFLQ